MSFGLKEDRYGFRMAPMIRGIRVGCKRHIAVDTDGRLLMINITPTDLSDSAGAMAILEAIKSAGPG